MMLIQIHHIFLFSSVFIRTEEVTVRHLLAIRSNFGHPRRTNPEDEGSGLCYLQRDQQRLKCTEVHAGVPFL